MNHSFAKTMSRRCLAGALTAATSIALTGCVSRLYTNPSDQAGEPIAQDEGMSIRQWDQTPATYTRTGVNGNSTWFNFAGFQGQQGDLRASLLSLPLFGLNVLTAPFAAFSSGNSNVETKETTIEPTYSGSPPLVVEDDQNNGNRFEMKPDTQTNAQPAADLPVTPENGVNAGPNNSNNSSTGGPDVTSTPGTPTPPNASNSPAPTGR